MPRKKRIWYPGAIYHIMNRGNRRAVIFRDRADYIHFLEIIKDISKEYEFIIHSICLMTNHFHILIETVDTNTGIIMKKILGPYAGDYNRRYGLTGHVFEGRYTYGIVETERYFLEVSRYIHLNPVKAMIVDDPSAYTYSSYKLFVSDSFRPADEPIRRLLTDLVDTSRVLSYFDEDPARHYKEFVESRISHEEEEKEIQKEMKEDSMWLPL